MGWGSAEIYRVLVKLGRLALIPLAMLIVAIVRLIYPWKHIRFGVLMSERIGHLCGNTEVYLCEYAEGLHGKAIDIWTPWKGVSNHYFLHHMLPRVMHVDLTRFTLLLILCNKLFQGWERHDISNGTYDRDPSNLLEKYPPHLFFTAREEAQGEEGLRKMGIPAGAKWVCLIVRDEAYIPELGYHKYRDSDIDTYGLAVSALVERGYYVIRMGARVEKPFGLMHPMVIDYAANGMRDEFMDIYLGARCAFCVSSGTGWDSIPEVFRRPICFVNYVPLEYLRTYIPRSLAIFKHHWKDGKRMKLQEIYESGLGKALFAKMFSDAGVELVDNTPTEIRDVVLQMCDEVAFGEKYADPNQEAFWRDFPRSTCPYTQRQLQGKINMRIGREFLKGYQ